MRQFKTLKAAEQVAGKLSTPSKMPGYAYGLPATACITGALVAKIPGTVCNKCYALKGRYTFPNVRNAQEFRLNAIKHPDWVDAMVFMIKKREETYFRWHDSGDIQGPDHLKKIVEIANRCPKVKFWLPTREVRMVREYLSEHGRFPDNLVVRVSGNIIDGKIPTGHIHTSTVVTENPTCPSSRQGNVCADCRMCWDPNIATLSYLEH